MLGRFYIMRDNKVETEEQKISQTKSPQKTTKIQIISIVVTVIVAIVTTFMSIFTPEIRKGVYDLFNVTEQVTPTTPVNELLSSNIDISVNNNDKTNNNEIAENASAHQDSNDNISEKSITEQTTEQSRIISPKVSLGTEVTSIEFLQIESDNIFVANRASASVETFYNGFEKEYREANSDPNTYCVFNVDGYGLCCTMPLKSKGNLYYSGELCDYSKISIGQEESCSKYNLNCFMGIDENDQMILGFSFEKPLASGTYYCLFKIYDSDSGTEDNVYIKFRVQ